MRKSFSWLHQIVKRGDLVALGDVVGIAGDKDNVDVFIGLPDLLGKGHAIDTGHFDVKKQKITGLILLPAEQKGFR